MENDPIKPPQIITGDKPALTAELMFQLRRCAQPLLIVAADECTDAQADDVRGVILLELGRDVPVKRVTTDTIRAADPGSYAPKSLILLNLAQPNSRRMCRRCGINPNHVYPPRG